MKKLTLASLSLLCAGTLHAFLPMSSRIDLTVTNGGLLAKDGIVTISLDSLKKSATYTVTCTLSNSNDSPVDVQFIQDKVSPSFTVENVISRQAGLKKGDSIFEAHGVTVNYPNSSISIRNLDNDYSINVNHCYATPEHF